MNRALREAAPFLLPLAIAWPLLARKSAWRHVAFGAATGAILAFFRDPERTVPDAPGIMVAPADGRVMEVDRQIEEEITRETRIRISIFLSILDVHINRAPLAGKVIVSRLTPGEFLDARNPRSAWRNTARSWAIESEEGITVVRQITGAVARRICPWAEVGQTLERGERFGMIRFGSRTDLFLPAGYEPTVHPGSTVRGGATVVATKSELAKP